MRPTDEWRFELAALQGSSYLALPRPLAWVVATRTTTTSTT